LYVNREEGFIGFGAQMKKDELVCNCSNLDDVIVFFRDGRYVVTSVADKKFIGKDIYYINIFNKNDKRTIYNVVYRDGKDGWNYFKRFAVTSVVHDREYTVTQGKEGSRMLYFTANPNGEAEIVKATLKPNQHVKNLTIDLDFSQVLIKGRQAMGNILTKFAIHRITLKAHGVSTLGGREVWFDDDVKRLNYDGHGRSLGEFQNDELILVVLDNGDFYTTDFDTNNHYDDNILIMEKFDPHKVWTAVLYDESQKGYPYVKRFNFEATTRKQNYLGDNPGNKLILLTDQYYARFEVTFGGGDAFRGKIEIDADEFIAIKGYKAKGKRLTTFAIKKVKELEPTRFPEKPVEQTIIEQPEVVDPDAGKSNTDILDELTGQMKLFD
jgi:topoisomerase-4 subunit A